MNARTVAAAETDRRPADLGGGHAVTGWLWQRGTAAVLALGLPGLGLYLWLAPAGGYAAWRALFLALPLRIAVLLCGLGLGIHAWLGMRDVLRDYVPWPALRLVLYAAVVLTLAAQGLWLVHILWSL